MVDGKLAEAIPGLETVPESPTSAEIEFFFAPSKQERSFIGNRRRPLTRLGLIAYSAGRDTKPTLGKRLSYSNEPHRR